jgi:hypothetical protein
MDTEIKVVLQDNGEIVELTGEAAQVYLNDIAEQVESLSQFKQEIVAKEEAKARGIEILQSLGLDEEAAKAIAGI